MSASQAFWSACRALSYIGVYIGLFWVYIGLFWVYIGTAFVSASQAFWSACRALLERIQGSSVYRGVYRSLKCT